MIKRDTEIEVGMWNENFISWGAEDCEFYFRLNSFGRKVGRVLGDIYHFEHGRTFNSHYHNPKFMDNHNLWQDIRTWDADKLIEYYQKQDYNAKEVRRTVVMPINELGNMGRLGNQMFQYAATRGLAAKRDMNGVFHHYNS